MGYIRDAVSLIDFYWKSQYNNYVDRILFDCADEWSGKAAYIQAEKRNGLTWVYAATGEPFFMQRQ